MDNKEINRKLRDRAIAFGLCKEWQGQWNKEWTEDKMIAMYKKGIDFCLANDYPSNGFIKANFTQEALRKGGVLIDERYSVNNRRTVVIKGKSEIKARYNGFCIGSVYVTDNSTLALTARNNSHVIVHVLGKAAITAEQYGSARLLIIRHSATCSIVSTGKVEVKDELGWLK